MIWILYALAALKMALDRNKKTLSFDMVSGGTARRTPLLPLVMVGSKWARMLESILLYY